MREIQPEWPAGGRGNGDLVGFDDVNRSVKKYRYLMLNTAMYVR